jgi:hypothetical protein
MRFSTHSRWCLVGLAAVVLGFGLELQAQPAAPGKGDPKVMRTRVFRLKNFDADKAVELLEELLTEPVDVLGPQPGKNDGPPFGRGVGAPGPGQVTPGPGGQPLVLGNNGPAAIVPYPRLPPPPNGQGFPAAPNTGLPGPLAGRQSGPFGPNLGAPAGGLLRYRLTVDEKTKAIMMRGPEPDVVLASELMTVLDLPEDQPVPGRLVAIRAFRLKDADAEKVAENLQGLGPRAKIVSVPELRLVIAAGPDQDLKDLSEAIKTLDNSDPDGSGTRRKVGGEVEDGKRPKNEGPVYRDDK